ncbi:hypothetical protein C8Q79DRAFT_285489 [Trametes meyenii]|nr:hypothetical protein C8Q79DRAFT_285489 [Trametes meyenii]
MANKAVRMEAEEFMATYFPLPPSVGEEDRPQWPSDVFGELVEGGALLEAEIMSRFIQAVNENKLAGDLLMACSSEKPEMEEGDEFRQKIDAAFFKEDNFPLLHDGRPRWADQVVPVEFKRHETNKDPFDDRDEDRTDADSIERKKVRGQVITYAEYIFRVQHRTALFMLLVIGRNFRFLRWDRSGTIVTRAIDYVSEPDVLCEFLWRMSLQSDEALGVDPSATRVLPGDADYAEMDDAAVELESDLATEERVFTAAEVQAGVQVFKYVRQCFRQSLQPEWPRYRVEVPDGAGTRHFLVGRPVFYAHGMVGRGTRGYVALDCISKRFVWLKDAWRVHYDLVDQEGSILGLLNEKKIANVPTLLCHGDIRNQTTDTPRVWEEKHPPEPVTAAVPPLVPIPASQSSSCTLVAPPPPPLSSSTSRKRTRTEFDSEDTALNFREESPLRHHMHYRIVEREVAMPLSEFQTGRQLVSVVLDCIVAHWEAHKEANIMHRDVSGGNVLIYPKVEYVPETNEMRITWTGLLADWEMSKPVSEKVEFLRPRQPPRTGTWQFLSAAMLSRYPGAVEIADELEAFFYVILYHGVRYLKSNCEEHAFFLEGFFDAYTWGKDGVYTCGAAKANAVKKFGVIEVQTDVPLTFDSPLDCVLDSLLPSFKARYAVLKYDEEIKKPKPTPKAPVIASRDKNGFTSSHQPHMAGQPLPTNSAHQKRRRVAEKSSSVIRKRASALVPPTPEERRDANLVGSHEYMIEVLEEVLDMDGWTDDDKVGDQVPNDYQPNYPIAPGEGAAESTVKRRREASSARLTAYHPYSFPLLAQPPKSALT